MGRISAAMVMHAQPALISRRWQLCSESPVPHPDYLSYAVASGLGKAKVRSARTGIFLATLASSPAVILAFPLLGNLDFMRPALSP